MRLLDLFRKWSGRGEVHSKPAALPELAVELPPTALEPAESQQTQATTEAVVSDTEDPGREPRLARRKPIENFDDFMTRKAADLHAKWLSASVAGVTHRNDDGSSRQAYIRGLEPYQELVLERDPHNAFSRHAIKILDGAGHQIGHVPEWMARDVSEAMDSGGDFGCYLQHTRQTSSSNVAVAVGVLWRAKLSPRNEFRVMLDGREDVEEWFWAKLSGMNTDERQEAIAVVSEGDQLELVDDESKPGSRVLLATAIGDTVAALAKQHSEVVLGGWTDGRSFEALVFEVREHARGRGMEPVVAICLLKEPGH